MKYLLIVTLFILSVVYVGYYIYTYDKNDNAQKSNKIKNTASNDNNINKIKIPDHLTPEFWKNVTFEELKEKLKNIKNINEVRQDTNQSMLHLLVRYGQYTEMIDLLIEAGVDYKLMDKDTKFIEGQQIEMQMNKKALHDAAIRGSYEFTKALLKYDTEVNAFGSFYLGSQLILATPLANAINSRAPIEVIKLLLKKGADPNTPKQVKDKKQPYAQPLENACVPNVFNENSVIDPEVIKLLLDYKAELHKKNFWGQTAFECLEKNEEFTKTELFKTISFQTQ